MPDIWFPNLGIKISHLSKSAFSIFGLEIAWYGIIIAIGVIAGYLVAAGIAKKTKQNPEMYLDFLIFALIFAIIGARLYYVIFSWDQYKDNLLQIFNLRNGGLAIFGGVIGAVATAVVFCKKKKYDFWLLADTAVPGLILGQAMGEFFQPGGIWRIQRWAVRHALECGDSGLYNPGTAAKGGRGWGNDVYPGSSHLFI